MSVQLSPIIDLILFVLCTYAIYGLRSSIWRPVHTRTCTLEIVPLTFRRKIDSVSRLVVVTIG